MNEPYIPEEEQNLHASLPDEEPGPLPEPAVENTDPAETIPAEEISEAVYTVTEEVPQFDAPIVTDITAEEIPEAIPQLILEEAESVPEEPTEEMNPELTTEEIPEEIPELTADDGILPAALLAAILPEPEPDPEAETPAAESEPQIAPRKERPVRKSRPRRPKGDGLLSIPHLLAAVIWLLIILAIGTSLGRIIWVCAADVLAFGRESRDVSISITTEDTMETIAEKLHDAGLIQIPELFLLYADLADVEEEHKITTGTFTLNTMYDYNALVNHMGPRATNRAVVEDVLIPEGFSCRQIFALLEQKGICKAADLEAYAATGALKDYWFLEGVERGDKYCLEGFLFPDTYDFYENSTPKLALEKMLDGFQYRFTEKVYADLPLLNEQLTEMMRKDGKSEEFIAENQLTLQDLLTVASMIEKETASTSESYRIASVIYNRLFRWGNTPRYLNIDASIIYALEGKTDLTAEDMAVDSPYNTYTNTGLTPGPIANPGLASIQAALHPEETNYYYYVLNPSTGEHQFSKTYAEHTEWVEKFREASGNG